MLDTYQVGDVRITRIHEYSGPTHDPKFLLPDMTPEQLAAERDWMAPDHWVPAMNKLVLTVQLWLVHAGDQIIVVDTGVGNGKPREGMARILHAERDGADAGPVQTRKTLREAVGLGVDDEVDAALAVEQHVLVAVSGDGLEAHALEQRAHGHGVGCGVLDELEAVGAHRVIPWLELHVCLLGCYANLSPSIDLQSRHLIANNSPASRMCAIILP